MSDPQWYTADQARDPGTPGQVLADIAALRPDLRPAVAGNPAAYPGLLHWLGDLGEPAVDAALAARSVPVPSPSLILPRTDDAGALAAVLPHPRTEPTGETSWSAPHAGPDLDPWGARPSRPTGTGHVPSPFGAAPAVSAAPLVPPASQPFPVGLERPGPYGYRPSEVPARTGRSSRRVVWVVLSVVAAFVLLGVLGFFGLRAVFSSLVADAYGADAELDALYDACSAEDWGACDSLYYESPLGSEYEEYGDTCGGRTSGGGFCVEEFGTGAGTSASGSAQGEHQSSSQAHGDDARLDVLWDACAAGDDEACDDLYAASPAGSVYEEFGDTCGGRRAGGEWCAP